MKYLVVTLFMAWSMVVIGAEPPTTQASPVEIERARKRLYPGGRDEEDLKVLAALPEASTRTGTRQIQKEVHKKLFDEELKDDEPTDGEIEH